MSPILVRPVREQLEHDRVIRLLQAKFRRRYEVGINPGADQTAAVGSGASAMFPDLVLTSSESRRRIEAIIEVETSESVNNLEAIGQWARLAHLRAPLHLYVPAGSVDTARRFCTENQIAVAELGRFTASAIDCGSRWCTGHRPTRASAGRAARSARPQSRTCRARARPVYEQVRQAPASQESHVTEIGARAETQVAVPYLRFARDTRGYESTSVLHTFRRRGASRPRILYSVSHRRT